MLYDDVDDSDMAIDKVNVSLFEKQQSTLKNNRQINWIHIFLVRSKYISTANTYMNKMKNKRCDRRKKC